MFSSAIFSRKQVSDGENKGNLSNVFRVFFLMKPEVDLNIKMDFLIGKMHRKELKSMRIVQHTSMCTDTD